MPSVPNYSGEMMNQREELDQLLSAYFDGELVNDEHSCARTLLEDAENQRVVDEFEVLHADIQSLPQRKLPSGFTHDLVAEIDRQARTQLSPASRWQRAILFVATAAAAILLMWAVFRQRGGDDPHRTAEGKDKSKTIVTKDGRPTDDVVKDDAVKDNAVKDNVPKDGRPKKNVPNTAVAKDGKKKETVKGSQLVDNGTGKTGPRTKKDPILELPKKFLFTIEIVLTDQAAREGSFERVLGRNGIQFQPDLKVDTKLEKNLLNSRILKDVVERKGRVRKSQVQLVYVLADPDRVDPMWDQFRRMEGHVADLKFNMAYAPNDLKVFEQLQRVEQQNFARLDAAKKKGSELFRARKLLLQMASLTKLARTTATSATLRSVPGSPFRVLGNTKDKKKDEAPHNLVGREKSQQILFIVHRLPPK